MKNFLWIAVAMLVLSITIGVALALGLEWSGALHGATVTVDGETLDGALVAALAGGAAAVGVMAALFAVVAVLASVAIAIPIALLAVAFTVTVALFVGLAPLFIPVLLVVGAYVLLSRRAKRRATAEPVAVFPNATTAP